MKKTESTLRELYKGSSTLFGICAAFYVGCNMLIATYEVIGRIIATVGMIVFGLLCYRTMDEIKQTCPKKGTTTKVRKTLVVIAVLFWTIIWPNMTNFPRPLAMLFAGLGSIFLLRFLLLTDYPEERTSQT